MEMADICHRVNSAVGRWATPISAAWLAARVLEGAAARYWKWHGGASWTQGWPRRAEAPRRASRLAPRAERSASAIWIVNFPIERQKSNRRRSRTCAYGTKNCSDDMF